MSNDNKYNNMKKNKSQAFLTKKLTKPAKPKIIKIKLDTNSIVSGLNLAFKNFPKNRAIELLQTIPKMQPKIKENL